MVEAAESTCRRARRSARQEQSARAEGPPTPHDPAEHRGDVGDQEVIASSRLRRCPRTGFRGAPHVGLGVRPSGLHRTIDVDCDDARAGFAAAMVRIPDPHPTSATACPGAVPDHGQSESREMWLPAPSSAGVQVEETRPGLGLVDPCRLDRSAPTSMGRVLATVDQFSPGSFSATGEAVPLSPCRTGGLLQARSHRWALWLIG